MKMEKCVQKIAIVTISVLLLFSYSIHVYATGSEKTKATKRIVRVGIPETWQTDGENSLSAFQKDYLQALAQYTNWEYEYTKAPFPECLEMVKTGKLDLLMCVSKTNERRVDFAYSSEPVGTEQCYMFGRMDTKVNYNDYDAFNGMKVGYEAGCTIIDRVKEYGKNVGFALRAKEYETQEAMYKALDAKEIDAVVQSSFEEVPTGYVLIAQCSPDPVYIVTEKKSIALKEGLDNAMSQLFSYNYNFNVNLFEHHFKTNLSQNVSYTEEEINYLKKKPVVDVYYETNWMPFEYDHKKNAEGITPDVLRAIGKETGITFRFQLFSSTQEVYSGVNKASQDAIMAVSYDYSWANDHDLLVTQPYIAGTVTCVTKKNKKNISTVATVVDGYLESQVQKKYPNLKIVSYPNPESCMEALAHGKVDCTFLNYYQASYYRRMGAYQNFRYQQDGNITQAIALGIRKGSDPALFGIVSKVLRHISQDELQEIISKNEDLDTGFSVENLLHKYPIQTAAVAGTFISLLGLLLVLSASTNSRRQQNIRLGAAKAEAELANHAKTDFISRISHDIRTPIGAISNMTDFAFEDIDNPEKLKDDLRKIQISNMFLLSLINDVLDISKIDSGNIELHLEPYQYADFISNIRNMFEPLCEKKNIRFVIGKEPDIKAIYVDPVRFNQVAMNLISNAVKYTPEGGTVKVTLLCSKQKEHKCDCALIVEDTGIGMSEEFQKKMYEPFAQEYENPGREKEVQGSGLGLSLVKKIINLIDGTIVVNSRIGEGTKIKISFIAREADPVSFNSKEGNKNKTKEEEKLSGTVLMAEDNEINTVIAKRILESIGLSVVHAENGKKAVEIFKDSKPSEFRAIFMDIHMPIMDGYDATKAIRALDRKDAKTIPIIAMTADAFSAAVEHSRLVGMTDYVTKPLNEKRLREVLIKRM